MIRSTRSFVLVRNRLQWRHAAFVIDLVENQTLDTNEPVTTEDKNFCTPITEDPAAFGTLFP